MTRTQLITYTGEGHLPEYAAAMLIFAKSTRTHMTKEGLRDLYVRCQADPSWMMSELDYIANTIPGSWEFVDYTFLLDGVTRTLTHQLVRTRTASYAQQSMQINDHSGFEYRIGPSIDTPDKRDIIRGVMAYVRQGYKDLLAAGVKTMDAREILPTGAHTNILVKMNFRTLIDLLHTRLSPRNAGEFVDVAKEMREAILLTHPWAEVFLNRTVDKAFEELDALLAKLPGDDVTSDKYKMLKLVDQLRRKL